MPLNIWELVMAVGAMVNSKAPGAHWLPNEIYQKYRVILLLFPTDLRTRVFTNFHEEIMMLPMPGKDPLLPDFLTTDVTVLAEVFTNRLNKMILFIIHPNKTGFMPVKYTSVNIRCLKSPGSTR